MSYYMGQEKFSLELLLLLQSAQDINEGRRKKMALLLSQPINWDLFLQMTIHHRVVPTVYKTLRGLMNWNLAVPQYALQFLERAYGQYVFRSMMMTGEMIRMVRIFQKNGIPSLVLKGAPLAQKVYGDISLRISKDIDLLVSPEDLERAEKILMEEGYEKKTIGSSLTSRQTKVHLNKFHHYVYMHSEQGVCVELHWKMHQIDLKFPVFTINLAPSTVDIGGCSVPVLPDEEWLFFLMVHGGSHKWFRLRWLFDIERFLKCSEVNWDKIMLLADHSNMTILVHQTLLLLQRFFYLEFPEKILKTAAQDKKAVKLANEVISHLFDRKEDLPELKAGYWKNFWWIHGYRFRLRTGWKYKLSYIHSLVQPIEDDFRLVSLPDSLYPLYYFIRPVTWLRRRFIGYARRNLR